jgi:hypothetical protein
LVVLLQTALAQLVGFLHALGKQALFPLKLQLIATYPAEDFSLRVGAFRRNGRPRRRLRLPSAGNRLATTRRRYASLPRPRFSNALRQPESAGDYQSYFMRTAHVVSLRREWLVLHLFIDIGALSHSA